MFSRNEIDCSDSHSPDKSLCVVRSIELHLSHLAHGPDFVASLLQGIVLGRFSFAAFCLYFVFTLPTQAAALAFAEAAILTIGAMGHQAPGAPTTSPYRTSAYGPCIARAAGVRPS
jgi:hypothetical protein